MTRFLSAFSDTRTPGRRMAIAAWLFYLLSLIPLLVLAFYSFPAADDFRMGYRAHEVWLSTGSVIKTLASAFPTAVHYYRTWIGYYTSAAFSAVPPSTFSTMIYWLSVWGILLLLTVSVAAFLRILLVNICDMDRCAASIITALTLFFLIHAMPETARAEAFFWHSGSWNYTATFSLGLLFIAALSLFTVRAQNAAETKQPFLIFITCALGFCAGGGNYLSALSVSIVCAIWLLLFLLPVRAYTLFDVQKPRFPRFLPIPILIFLAGFLMNCTAPGNSIRAEGMGTFGGFGALRSIGISLYYTMSYCIHTWTRTEHLLLLAFLAPVFWKNAPQVRRLSFQFPLLVCTLAYGLASANMTPVIYTSGTIDTGRIHAVIYMQYLLLLVLSEGYLIGWLRHWVFSGFSRAALAEGLTEAHAENTWLLRYLSTLTVVFFSLSALLVGVHPSYYTGTQALTELVDGSASLWRAESRARLLLLTDGTIDDPVLTRHRAMPALLSMPDISEDPTDWINDGVARYYHKNSVRLEASESTGDSED